MTITIHCGTFEAERYWRDKDLAVLPFLPNRSGIPIIDAMDEMLFVFCKRGDTLLTRGGIEKAHYEYLQAIGFEFQTNVIPLSPDPSSLGESNIFELLNLLDTSTSAMPKSLLPEGARLEPFAVLPGAAATIQRYSLSPSLPSEDVVSRVNSKTYSVTMREKLGIPNIGKTVEHPEQLSIQGKRLLEGGAFLIKDDYGVSGKGNLLVDSERTLQRLVVYLSAQVEKGKRMRFVLEPFLDRDTDFSCQFRLERSGEYKMLAVQQLRNAGFAFHASHSSDLALMNRLIKTGYFELMERIGALLHEDGYYGDVCVDSMLLRDGAIEPLVEINARKSMSLIKHYMDKFLNREGLKGCLTQVNVVSSQTGSSAGALEYLEESGVLYHAGKGNGIIPLTSGTLFPRNRNATGVHKGKLYAAIAYRNDGDLEQQSERLKAALSGFGLKVVV